MALVYDTLEKYLASMPYQIVYEALPGMTKGILI